MTYTVGRLALIGGVAAALVDKGRGVWSNLAHRVHASTVWLRWIITLCRQSVKQDHIRPGGRLTSRVATVSATLSTSVKYPGCFGRCLVRLTTNTSMSGSRRDHGGSSKHSAEDNFGEMHVGCLVGVLCLREGNFGSDLMIGR